ncbi:hypothetical protein BIU90_07070 [Curtobacterium sp. MCBA15_001]|nr:hypothetical protein BIU90_07070 [Curtobacterium sp. MCBA15_001]
MMLAVMRRLIFLWLSVVLLLIAAVAFVTVPGRSGPSAPLPAPSASAKAVAAAFLNAAVRRNCPDMRALSDPDDTDWCPANRYEQWAGDGDPTIHSWSGLRSVSEHSDPQQCFMYDMDQSGATGMSPGAITFGLCLRHQANGWRVSNEGVGY